MVRGILLDAHRFQDIIRPREEFSAKGGQSAQSCASTDGVPHTPAPTQTGRNQRREECRTELQSWMPIAGENATTPAAVGPTYGRTPS
jgi:hypothetical protein